MKKALVWIAVLLVCLAGTALAAGLALDQSGTVRLALGESLTVHVTSIPEGETVRFSSTYSGVAKVDAGGTVTALKEGTTTIKAVTSKWKSASFTVKVYDPAKPTKLILDQGGTAQVNIGAQLQLTHAVTPATADKAVKYASSNKAVAEVSETGLVTGKKEGTVTVTVTSKKVTSVKAAIKIKVVDPYKPTQMTLGQTGTVVVNVETNLQITHTMAPATADTAVKYATSNKAVVSIDESGLASAHKEGTVTVTVTSRKNPNVKASFKIKVVDPYKPTKMTLDPGGAAQVNIGTPLQITHTMAPATADTAVKYASSNKAIAEVSETGLVAGKKEGTVTVTVTSRRNPHVKATLKVKVVDPFKPTKMTLDRTGTVTVNIDTNLQITHTMIPATAETAVRYSSYNKAVATVDENGLVTAHKEGTTTVTVTSRRNPSVTASVKIKVVDPYKPARIILEQTGTAQVNIGAPLQIGHRVEPATADKTVKYASGNKAVAEVSETGLVTGKKEGTVTVTLTSKRNPYVSATLKVKVVDPAKPTKMALGQTGTVSLVFGETLQLTHTMTPATADKAVKYSSYNKAVASVDENGLVSANKEGATTITVTSKKNPYVSATVKIKVVDPYKPDKLTLTPSGTADLFLGDTLTVAVSVYPSTADGSARFASSAPSVASVDEYGVVTPKKEGTATITATSKKVSSKKASVKIRVLDPTKPASIKLTPSGTIPMDVGTDKALTYTLAPETAVSEVTYSTKNSKVAKVSADGVITAVGEGTTTITARTKVSGRTDTVQVKVTDPRKPTSVKIPGERAYTIGTYDTVQLSTAIQPATAAEAKITWKSSNGSVASVTSSGKVTGLTAGTAYISASSAGKSDKIKVTVKKGGMPTGVNIAGALSYHLKVGQAQNLSASFEPSTAFGGLTWESTNPMVASVDQQGHVTAIRPGKAAILAKSDRNGVTGKVTVAVTSDDPKVQNQLPLAGLVIGIDPGHQVKGDTAKEPIAPGSSKTKVKVTDGTRGNWTHASEYNVNLLVGLKLRDKLTALGAEVYMTRTTNYVNLSNIQRAQMMNDAGCDLVLRLHCNGSDNSYDSGIYIYAPAAGAISSPSHQAALVILSSMKSATGVSRGSASTTSTYTGLNWSTVPSVLIEMGYMSNYTEDYRLSDPAYQEKLADGMVSGIRTYFNRD